MAPSDGHDTTGEFDPAFHSFTGVNSVSLPGYAHGSDEKVLQAVDELAEEYPYDLDYNDGKPNGIGKLLLHNRCPQLAQWAHISRVAAVDGRQRDQKQLSHLIPRS